MILASKSPRRKELLKTITNDFKVLTSETEEKFKDNLSVYENIMNISNEKCNSVRLQYNIKNDIIIGGDTICYMDNMILGKPIDYDHAFKMIKSFNNKTQEVITGVTLMKVNESYIKTLRFYEISYVTFKNITEREIKKWLDRNEFLDKAGSYGIQDNSENEFFNMEYTGSFNNIVGFPVEKIEQFLKEL